MSKVTPTLMEYLFRKKYIYLLAWVLLVITQRYSRTELHNEQTPTPFLFFNPKNQVKAVSNGLHLPWSNDVGAFHVFWNAQFFVKINCFLKKLLIKKIN